MARHEHGYGSAGFEDACRVASDWSAIKVGGVRGSWLRLRAGSLRLLWYCRRLPAVELRLTSSPAGRMIGEHFAIREGSRWRYRRAQGVLRLPADYPRYLRGHHRQAVRTNVRHARDAHLIVRSRLLENWIPGASDRRQPHIRSGPVEHWTVTDPAGETVAQAVLSVDDEVALLQGLTSSVSYARWLLHTAIVERLCGQCQVLVANCEEAYLMSRGDQHFQRLLGYELARLRLPGAARSAVFAMPAWLHGTSRATHGDLRRSIADRIEGHRTRRADDPIDLIESADSRL